MARLFISILILVLPIYQVNADVITVAEDGIGDFLFNNAAGVAQREIQFSYILVIILNTVSLAPCRNLFTSLVQMDLIVP